MIKDLQNEPYKERLKRAMRSLRSLYLITIFSTVYLFSYSFQIFIDHFKCVRCYSGPSESYKCEPVVDPDPKELIFKRKINHINTSRDA